MCRLACVSTSSIEMEISEQDASDLISKVLFAHPDQDDSFIDMWGIYTLKEE